MHSPNLNDKSVACLLIAAAHEVPYDDYSRIWDTRYRTACERYSEKAVNVKMEELSRRGYIEYGASARTGWLTVKGKNALKPHIESFFAKAS